MSQPRTIRERLNLARQQRFVGREREISEFVALLEAEECSVVVLYVFGPGGVGKSSLLDVFGRVALERRVPVARFDARDIDPLPHSYREVISASLAEMQKEDVSSGSWRAISQILMIDTYELAAPVDNWLRDEFLPELPDHTLVVLAGRNAPSIGWRTDEGWHELMQVVSLRNLRPEEVEQFLVGRGLDKANISAYMQLTYGHPLALSLLADLGRSADGNPPPALANAPNLVSELLERFVREIPNELHRTALEVCAHSRVTTEGLLRDAVSEDGAGELFNWLRGLSFIQEGPFGLYPHDLARDVLDADLRWRDLPRYQAMHARVRAPIIRLLKETRGARQQRAADDMLFLHRNGPVMGQLIDWETLGRGRSEEMHREDLPAMLDALVRHESEESAEVAAFWYERQPEAFFSMRDERERLLGFETHLTVRIPDDEEIAADPAIRAAWRYILDHSPLREGESLVYARFSFGIETYQDITQASNLAQRRQITTIFSAEQMGITMIAMRAGGVWGELMEYLSFPLVHEAGFRSGEHWFDVYVHDWRLEPIDAWMEIMGEREIASEPPEARALPPAAPLLVLSRPDFDAAIKQALRDLHQPEALARNPLLRSRLVLERDDDGSPAEHLANLILNAAESLRDHPRHLKLYRALDRTYLHPVATQELAAESLGLPFNTYRYQLSGAIRRVSDQLWQQEVSR